MANIDGPKGFVPIGDPITQEYSVDASNGAIIGKGDPIIGEADGNVARAAATSGVAIVAVAVGFKNTDGQAVTHLPASTAGTVIAVPIVGKQRFRVQSDSGTSVTLADVHATADLAIANADTTTGISNVELDASDIGTGTTFRIDGLDKTVGNAFGEHADLTGYFVESAYKDATTI